VRVDFGGVELLLSGDAEAVGKRFDLGAEEAEIGGGGFDAVGFLDTEFGGVLHEEALLTARAEDGEDRDFVDEGGGPFAFDDASFELRTPDEKVSDGFAVAHGDVEDPDFDAHGDKEVDESGTGGIETDAMEDDAGAGDDGGSDEKEGSGGEIAGDGKFAGLEAGAAVDGDETGAAFEGGAEFAEGDFSVVAGGGRFADGGDAVGEESSEEDAAFHLGAGDGHCILDGAESATGNFNGGEFAVAGDEGGAHLGEGGHDALHGALGKGLVADEAGGEGLAGEEPGQHADGGTGVACVEVGGGGGPVEAAALNGDVAPLDGDAGAEGFDAAEGGVAVSAGGVVGDFGDAGGRGGKHGIAVGDGFIAGKADGAIEGPGGGGDGLLHEGSLVTRFDRGRGG